MFEWDSTRVLRTGKLIPLSSSLLFFSWNLKEVKIRRKKCCWKSLLYTNELASWGWVKMQRRNKKIESRGIDHCRVGCDYITEITGLDYIMGECQRVTKRAKRTHRPCPSTQCLEYSVTSTNATWSKDQRTESECRGKAKRKEQLCSTGPRSEKLSSTISGKNLVRSREGGSATGQDPLVPSWGRHLSHILCCSPSVQYPDNRIWCTFPELFNTCENPPPPHTPEGRC